MNLGSAFFFVAFGDFVDWTVSPSSSISSSDLSEEFSFSDFSSDLSDFSSDLSDFSSDLSDLPSS